MISEHEARQKILNLVQPTDAVEVALGESLHGYAAEDVHASVPIPGFDNSMMDGYALVAADSTAASPLRVSGEQPAGRDLGLSLQRGEAVRIFTGAPMPSGADAVIMQEDVEVTDAGEILCREPVEMGENVRRAGADLCRGQRVLTQGERLSPARLSLLASQGRARVRMHRRPRIAVLSTGDELIPPGEDRQLAPGEVFNSNGVMIEALCREDGIRDIDLRHCGDDFQATVETLRQLICTHDAIILSGGVSVGDHDHVRPALKELGISPELWRVRVKPGKPFLFAQGQGPDGRPVSILGLPGNPVSSFVTFHLFVRGCLRRLMGAPLDVAQTLLSPVTVSMNLTNDGDRPHYLRGRVDNGAFTPQGLQQSHALATLAHANALLRVEAQTSLNAGETGEALLLTGR